jgi:spermidine dehydrogenase
VAKRRRESGDGVLGMDAPIARRDFLNASLLATGSVLLTDVSPRDLEWDMDWDGYGGLGDYARSNGNTRVVVEAAHGIRDGKYGSLPVDAIDTGELFDLVVVGAGLSGLAAAVLFGKRPGRSRTCLVLDNHAIFGGEAKRNEFDVDGHTLVAHQGSAFFPVPRPGGFIASFYDLIGMDRHAFDYQAWQGPSREMRLSQTPYDMLGEQPETYGLYFGARFGRRPGVWLIDPWGKKLEGAPISSATKEDLLRWRGGGASRPLPEREGDAESRRLDAMTLEDHIMERYAIGRDTVREFLSIIEGGGFGLGADALSAYCPYAVELQHPGDGDEAAGDQMFPDGNAGFARLMAKTLIDDAIDGPRTPGAVCHNRVRFAALDRPGAATRIRLGSTAVWVEHERAPARSDAVVVAYVHRKRVYRVRARAVIMAGGSWTTKHIVRGLPESHRDAYAQFHRSPCAVINVAVRNWRFLYDMGISGCRWFDGIAGYTEVRKHATVGAQTPTFGPDSPTVLTLKVVYSYPGFPIAAQGARGRAELFGTSFRDFERAIRETFTEMFAAAGFDASRDIAGIIVNRWGHAYVNPQPGFFFGLGDRPAPRDVLRRAPFGRIAFANTDLAGAMDHRNAIAEARRAVEQIEALD